jgi:hypothetical protein
MGFLSANRQVQGLWRTSKLSVVGRGFALLLLAATAQADGGKAITAPTASLAAGLSPNLSYILKRFYDCIDEVGKG